MDVLHRNVVYERTRHVVPVFLVIELCPFPGTNAIYGLAGTVFCHDIPITLWGVWAHLEEKNVAGAIKSTVADDDVARIVTFASESHATSSFLEEAVVNDDVAARTIGAVFVHKSAFATFDANAIVIDVYPATIDEHVLASINVYGVRARTFRVAIRRRVDIAVEVFHSFALVEMVRPETRVDHLDATDVDIVGM